MPENKSKIKYLESRPADVPRLWVDNGKLNLMIKLSPFKNFESGLIETINYYKELSNEANLLDEISLLNWKK